jgi:hypothetical protein
MRSTRVVWFGIASLAVLVACKGSGAPSGADDIANQPMGTLTAWVEHIGRKVQPTTSPGPGTSVALEGARRSYEASQIVVRGRAGKVTGVRVTASDLSDGSGHSIPASNITFFRQVFIDFTGVRENEPGNSRAPETSPTNDPFIPDPLVPFTDPYTGAPLGAPFAVAMDRNQPVWMDIAIPESASPGTYHGQVTVQADGPAEVTVPITLTVWNLVLPDKNAATTYFSTHLRGIADYHRDTASCQGSNCWLDPQKARTIAGRYEELAHAHRIDMGPNFIPEPAGPGGCSPPTDWDAYDAAMTPYMDGSYFSDGVPVSWLRTPFSPGVTWGPEANCNQAQYQELAAAWARHLKDKEWFSKAVVYAYDEPPPEAYPDIAKHAQWLINADPDWKARIMDTTSPTPESAAILNSALGVYCVCLRCYDHWYQGQSDYGRAEWPPLLDQGIQLWFYESNAQSDPFPTFATNTLFGFEPRVVLWGAWYEQATGFLLWDTMAHTADDPWGPNVGWGKSGDGVLIYPGHHDGLLAPAGSPADVAMDGPVPSYRLKTIRQGLQDWALFRLAVERGKGDLARAKVAEVYGQMGGCEWQGCPGPVNGSFFWREDPALMDQVRHDVAVAISQ